MQILQKLMLNSSSGMITREVASLFDGIANLRAESFYPVIVGCTIGQCLATPKQAEVEKKISKKLKEICLIFYPKPVWYRTTDFDIYIAMKILSLQKPDESCYSLPRGLPLALYFPELLKFEVRIISDLWSQGISNLGIKFPMVSHPQQIGKLQDIMEEMHISINCGLGIGITIETPYAALCTKDFIRYNLGFATVGMNDLVALLLGIGRENLLGIDSDYFSDPIILQLIKNIPASFSKTDINCLLSGVGIPSENALQCAVNHFNGIAVDFTDKVLVTQTREQLNRLANE